MGDELNEDEFLVAWLKKRGHQLMSVSPELWLTKQGVAHPQELIVGVLNMWVAFANPWKTKLHSKQRGKRRPLRSIVREWVIGVGYE